MMTNTLRAWWHGLRRWHRIVTYLRADGSRYHRCMDCQWRTIP